MRENAEQLEARQQAVNEANERFIATLPDDEKAKYEAIGKCMQILTDVNCPAVLFAKVPHNAGQLNEIFLQYNNLAALNAPENNGSYSERNYYTMSYNNHLMILVLLGYIGQICKPDVADATLLDWHKALYVMHSQVLDWYQKGILPPILEEQKKKLE